MRHHILIFIVLSVLISCERHKEMSSMNPINWKKRSIDLSEADSLT